MKKDRDFYYKVLYNFIGEMGGDNESVVTNCVDKLEEYAQRIRDDVAENIAEYQNVAGVVFSEKTKR